MLNLLAATACVIIFATGLPETEIIKAHEIGHCNGWHHKHEVMGLPPAKYNHSFHGRLYEQPVSLSEAKDRCQGLIGESLKGCSTGKFHEK